VGRGGGIRRNTYVPCLSWKCTSVGRVVPQLEVSVLLSDHLMLPLWSFSWIYRLRAHNRLAQTVCARWNWGVAGLPFTHLWQTLLASRLWPLTCIFRRTTDSYTKSIAKITPKAIPLSKTLTSNWGTTLPTEVHFQLRHGTHVEVLASKRDKEEVITTSSPPWIAGDETREWIPALRMIACSPGPASTCVEKTIVKGTFIIV
jgi:hypothetical protein